MTWTNARRLATTACLLLLAGCPIVKTPSEQRSPRAEKWYQRALKEYRLAAMDAAYDSARHALDLVPSDPEVRTLAAQAALARLEFDEALKQLKGIGGSTASSLRGRAYWYKGELERAADELDRMLADPEIKDPWAKEITKLARRGAGRRPFEIQSTEGQVAAVDMARVPPQVPFYVVPLELDGEKALALIATGTPEVMVDSTTRKESSWVSLRFDRRLEVKDVPALTRDLSGVSREVGAPIKVLLGVNLLRHLNVTLDHRGRQFVARGFIPSPPPRASRLDVFYLRGGGMVVGAPVGKRDDDVASLLVDTSLGHPLALTRGGFAKAGLKLDGLKLLQPPSKLRGAAIPTFKFGTFALSQVQAIHGTAFEALEREIDIDIDGAVGAGLLREYRLTLSDAGRTMWIEELPPIRAFAPVDSRPTKPDEPAKPGDPTVPPVPATTPDAPPAPGSAPPPPPPAAQP